jgi:hypothetical protein
VCESFLSVVCCWETLYLRCGELFSLLFSDHGFLCLHLKLAGISTMIMLAFASLLHRQHAFRCKPPAPHPQPSLGLNVTCLLQVSFACVARCGVLFGLTDSPPCIMTALPLQSYALDIRTIDGMNCGVGVRMQGLSYLLSSLLIPILFLSFTSLA